MQLQDRLMARTTHVRNFSPIVHPSLTHRFCWTLFVEHVEEDADESGMVGFAKCILMYLDAPSAETSFVQSTWGYPL